MILQNVIFPKPGLCTEEKLYFRRSNAEYTWASHKIVFCQGGTAVFDTYFNGFSIEKWVKYADFGVVFLKLRLYGDFRVTVVRKEKNFDEILTEFLAEKDVSCDDPDGTEVRVDFDIKKPYGILSFKLFAVHEGAVFYGGAFHSAKEPPNAVRLAVDICTFRRESFVKSNVRNLYEAAQRDFPAMKDNLTLFVVDNAGTLKKQDIEREGFSVLVGNRNLGGSGGFTRGIVETLRANDAGAGFTHILLMDDDVVFEPETVYRTFALMSYIRPKYAGAFIGGAMLRLDRQHIQTEAGGVWNGGKLISLKHGLDLNHAEACLYNEVEEQAEFHAWWYCAMPLPLLGFDNLPLPLFIRGDDVEYGLRNMKQLILLNGICVWHEPFENKYSSSMFYYIIRNRLIDNAVHRIPMCHREFFAELKDLVLRELVCYRYANVELTFKGIEDFFKGAQWLLCRDSEEVNKEVIRLSYKMDYIENLDVPFSYPKFEKDMNRKERPGKLARFFRLATFNGQLLPAQGDVILPIWDIRPVCLYRKERVLYYDIKSRKGFVADKDLRLTFRYLAELYRIGRRLKKEYEAAAADYFAHFKELTSLKNWERLFRDPKMK